MCKSKYTVQLTFCTATWRLDLVSHLNYQQDRAHPKDSEATLSKKMSFWIKDMAVANSLDLSTIKNISAFLSNKLEKVKPRQFKLQSLKGTLITAF